MKCTICEKQLSGGVDTFGSIRAPMCWTCHCEGWPVEVIETHMDLCADETDLEIQIAEMQADIEAAIADEEFSDVLTFQGQMRSLEKELKRVQNQLKIFEQDHPGIVSGEAVI